MIEVLFYLSWLFPIPAGIMAWKDTKDAFIGWTIGLGVVAVVFMLNMPVLVNYSSLVEQRAIVKQYQPIVEIQRSHVERLAEKINNADQYKQNILTSTHDTPVSSWIEAHCEAEKDLVKHEKAIALARLKIVEIEMGLFGFVAKWIKED